MHAPPGPPIGLARPSSNKATHCVALRHNASLNDEPIVRRVKHFKFILLCKCTLYAFKNRANLYTGTIMYYQRIYNYPTPCGYHQVWFHFTLRHKAACVKEAVVYSGLIGHVGFFPYFTLYPVDSIW